MEVLYPFTVVSEYLEGSVYPTVSTMFPSVESIKSKLNKLSTSSEAANMLRVNLIDELNTRFKQAADCTIMATWLDLRYKV